MITTTKQRRGFMVLESASSLVILAVAMLGVTQLAFFARAERERGENREAAVEAAENVLETAKSLDWQSLTAEWAASQKLPEHFGGGKGSKMTVTVEQEAKRPHLKRVVVRIDHKDLSGLPAAPVVSASLFSARQKMEKP